jgi:cation transport ATPase
MPNLVEILPAVGLSADWLLALVASLGRYSKHPLSAAIVRASEEKNASWFPVSEVSEKPGAGMLGRVDNHQVQITSRHKLLGGVGRGPENWTSEQWSAILPKETTGLECVVLVDGRYAGTFQFRDTPRSDGGPFVRHLSPRHRIGRTLLVSGDRDSEVRYLAGQIGIEHIFSSQSPEQKLAIVRAETERSPTIFVGDGINDAPALAAATVGIAFGQHSDVTSQAADAVVLDCSLQKVDEFLHISRRMRQIALQSALGGIGLSLAAMGFAAVGYLSPVWGAVTQELIDVLAVLNALRVAWPPGELRDF